MQFRCANLVGGSGVRTSTKTVTRLSCLAIALSLILIFVLWTWQSASTQGIKVPSASNEKASTNSTDQEKKEFISIVEADARVGKRCIHHAKHIRTKTIFCRKTRRSAMKRSEMRRNESTRRGNAGKKLATNTTRQNAPPGKRSSKSGRRKDTASESVSVRILSSWKKNSTRRVPP